MDTQKVWMLLQIIQIGAGYPQYAGIVKEANKELAEINNFLMNAPTPRAIPTAPPIYPASAGTQVKPMEPRNVPNS